MSTGPGRAGHLRTLAAGLTILDSLARRPFMKLVDISECTGDDPSRTHRLLATLEREGYVARTPEKAYYLSTSAITIGFSAQGHHPLVTQARDVLEWLVTETGHSSYLMVRRGRSRVVLDLRDSPQRLKSFGPIGEDHPIHVSGAGLAILAFSPPDTVEDLLSGPLESVTSQTETDPAAIRDILAVIRARGYHVAIEDFKVGRFSIGAPILDRGARCLGALAVAGPLGDFNEELERLVIDRVLEAGAEVSARLGFSGVTRS